jgi:hypothetical protein
MMSLHAIQQVNATLHRRYSKRALLPYDGTQVYWKTIPHVGWKPVRGFRETATHFVDISGFGEESEPALTQDQFLHEVREGRYYAFAEVGPFQAHIREFVARERK